MHSIKQSTLIPFLIAVAAVGYFLPWVITPATSLSLGAYDLAEWSSLHPLVRATAPFMWTALTLRVPLAILGVILAAHVEKTFQHKSIAILLVIITAIALLPPVEFFTIYRDDSNYFQQFLISLATLIIGLLVLLGTQRSLKTGILVFFGVMGIISSSTGLYEALDLLRGFEIPVTLGAGGIMTIVALALIVLLYITKQSS